MSYDQIWAPWRIGYLKEQPAPPATPDAELKFLPAADRACFFCRGVADTADRRNLIVARGPQTLVMLNRYPYTNGHLLVAPQLHLGDLDTIPADTQLECMQLLGRLTGVLKKLIQSEGFNIGLNLGRVAGAGVPGHLHWHIVPRWSGDSNFMPVLAGARLIPQSLDALWEALHEALQN